MANGAQGSEVARSVTTGVPFFCRQSFAIRRSATIDIVPDTSVTYLVKRCDRFCFRYWGGGGGGGIVCFPNTLCDCLLAVLPATMYIFGQRGWAAVGVEASRKFFMKGFFFYFFSFPFLCSC